MSSRSVVIAACCCLIVAACGGGGSGDAQTGNNNNPQPASSTSSSSPAYTQSTSYSRLTNNSAKISGANLGSGADNNSDLRKQVTLSIISTNPDFSLGYAYVTRPHTSTNDFINVIIKITNISVNLHCFIKATGVSFKNSNDQTINFNNFDYITGSVANSNTLTVSTDTCLKAGESGYILTNHRDAGNSTFYDDVNSIEIASIDVSNTSFSDTNPVLIPTDFKIYSDPVYSLKFTSNISNQSATDASLNQFSSYIVLDSTNTPVFWSFYDGPTGVVIAANGSLDMNESGIFTGTGKSIIAYVDFTEDFAGVAPFRASSVLPTSQAVEVATLLYEYENYRTSKYQFMMSQKQGN